MGKDYIEWLDWKPGILRAIFELGTYGKVNCNDLKTDVGTTKDSITEYLVSMNIAEFRHDGTLTLSEFGNELFRKLQDINYLFESYVDINDGDGD